MYTTSQHDVPTFICSSRFNQFIAVDNSKDLLMFELYTIKNEYCIGKYVSNLSCLNLAVGIYTCVYDSILSILPYFCVSI